MNVFIGFENKPLFFQNPQFVVSCRHPSAFAHCFQEIEQALSAGYYAAGFFSYEAGYCFEEKLSEDKTYDFPLLQVGIYKEAQKAWPVPDPALPRGVLSDLRLNISKERYAANIQKIHDYIAVGDVYQITYCLKLLFRFSGDPMFLYLALLREQPVPYPAAIETEHFHILSLSPELFLKKTGQRALTKPMKGTWPRSQNWLADILARFRLKFDAKNRAENVMIADLLRNDLGRVGTQIRAPKLFEVAGYKTLYQMTSTITGRVEKDIPLYRLFGAMFPSGSVTGAPRMRAMQIIRELEGEERKIYTGAIGYITPGRDMCFNIPIRTLLIQNGEGEMGIGGGIVWDSTAQGEWDEGLLKAKFVTDMANTVLATKSKL